MDRADRAAFVFIGILAILLVAVLAIAIYSSVMTHQARNALSVCLGENYPEVEYAHGEWYCIGIRDGSSVTVLVSEAGR